MFGSFTEPFNCNAEMFRLFGKYLCITVSNKIRVSDRVRVTDRFMQ